MRILIILFFFSSIASSLAQIPEHFPDIFKTAKWKSLDNFNDSTLYQMKELKLVKWNLPFDTLQYLPVLWIDNDTFKIKYYSDVNEHIDTISGSGTRSFNILNFKYSYGEKETLTLIPDNENKSPLRYKTGITSTGNFILLMKEKKK